MQQDLQLDLPPIEQTAQLTGGRFRHHAGDLSDELMSILDDRHARYQLSFTTKGPPDGHYHTIGIAIRNRTGLALRYRSGYPCATTPTGVQDNSAAKTSADQRPSSELFRGGCYLTGISLLRATG